jgi:hypothetical protein
MENICLEPCRGAISTIIGFSGAWAELNHWTHLEFIWTLKKRYPYGSLVLNHAESHDFVGFSFGHPSLDPMG